MSRLTRREWEAVNAALARVLADDNDDDVDVQAMASAQRKVWERIR